MNLSLGSKLTRRRFIGVALVAGALTVSPLCRAQQVAGSAPLLRPGMRLVWVGGAASIPGERDQIEPDVNGEWVNQRTGQRYTQFATPGAAGAGYVVIDVLDAEPGGFVLWVTTLLMHPGGTSTFIDANGLVADMRSIADFWVSPAQLGGLADRNEASLRVLRMPYILDGRTFRAVRIQSQNNGGWSQNTYDLDSGICIATGSTTQGAPVLTLGLGNTITSGAGNTQVTFTRFAGSRLTGLPGRGEVFPDAMRALRSLSYSGSKMVVMPGSPTFSLPVELRYDIVTNAGPYLTARFTAGGGAGPLDRVIAAGVIGSLWMNPQTLAGYGPGQILDQDPVTGVQAVAMGRQDNLAVLALQTALTRHSFAYDLRNGILVRADLRTQVGIATDILEVQLAGTQ